MVSAVNYMLFDDAFCRLISKGAVMIIPGFPLHLGGGAALPEINYVGHTVNAVAATGSMTMIKPRGSAIGDIYVLFVAANSYQYGGEVLTPTGFDLEGSLFAENRPWHALQVYSRVLSSTPGNFNVEHSLPAGMAGALVTLRPEQPTAAFYAADSAYDYNGPAIGSITTPAGVSNTPMVCSVTWKDTAAALTSSGGFGSFGTRIVNNVGPGNVDYTLAISIEIATELVQPNTAFGYESGSWGADGDYEHGAIAVVCGIT